MSLPRIALMSVLVIVMMGCQQPVSASPRLNNALLWKRLGLNRAIGGDQPQITSSKKKGESTVYFIKLPPQPHYYIPNFLPSSGGDHKATPDPFETVSVDFTANGKPANVYHWNLPLGFVPTTTTTTTTPAPVTKPSFGGFFSNKKPFRTSYYNNGKPQKLYFVKPSYSPTTPEPVATTQAPSIERVEENGNVFQRKKPYKKHFYGNGKPKHLFFVQPAHHKSYLI